MRRETIPVRRPAQGPPVRVEGQPDAGPSPLLRLQQTVGNRAAAAARADPAPAEPAGVVRSPAAAAPVPCRGCVGGGAGPVVRTS